MWPRTSWSLSSLTLNIVLGRASVISPSISIFSSAICLRAYLTCVFHGCGPVADLAGVLGRLELGEQAARLRPRVDAQLAGQLVAAQERRRGAVAAPVERGGDHLAGEPEVRLDHLRTGQGTGAAGRQAIGDREQGDVDTDRLGRTQIFVDAPARQGRLRNQESEPQVMERQALQVPGEAAAGPQPGADLADDLRAHPVVPTESDEAVAFGPGGRLADVVKEGTEAQGGAAAPLIGERLRQQRRDVVGASAGEAAEIPLDLQRVLEHGERVAVDVEVVIGSLFRSEERRVGKE